MTMNKTEEMKAENAIRSGRVAIRTVRFEDIPSLMEIEVQATPKTPLTLNLLLGYAVRFGETFAVLEVGKNIAGYIIFDHDGHLLSIAVKPVYRRRGFGTMLVFHALNRTRKTIWLEVRSKNIGAIEFYKKLKFSIAGRVKRYYGDDDALMMVWDKKKTGDDSPAF
jgi:[ribosomal protein S18]-alanine N-acetyltransferase